MAGRQNLKAIVVIMPPPMASTGAGGMVTAAVGRIAGAAGGILRRIPEAIASKIAEKIVEWCLRKISEYLRERKQEFIKATESPADGVTIMVTFGNPGLLPILCRALRGEPVLPTSIIIPRGIPSAQVQVLPGLRRG